MKEDQFEWHRLLNRFRGCSDANMATCTLYKSQACLIVHFRNLNSLLRTRKQLIAQKSYFYLTCQYSLP